MRRGITIIVERPPGFDDYGDPLPGAPETHTIENCAVSIRAAGGKVASSEVLDRGREGVAVAGTLFAPAGSDLRRSDRIVITDAPIAGRYDLAGDPIRWESPFTGWKAGIEVPLRRGEG